MVTVRTLDPQGQLTPPRSQPAVELSDKEWKDLLEPEAFRILRNHETEKPFCGRFHAHKESGWYLCAGCGLPLFHSSAKYESGTGWPSFFRAVAKENIESVEDDSYGMHRTEIKCARCRGHLGHVFDDGPAPTGQRFCLNSESMSFRPDRLPHARAWFAAGCFWGVQMSFDALPGVVSTRVGYMGGNVPRPSYPMTCTGTTGHAESIEIEYDSTKVGYEELVRFFFEMHDPTTVNRQGPDVGSEYRSALFVSGPEQEKVAKAVIADLAARKAFPAPIVTQVAAADEFFPAETYHQAYYKTHRVQCHLPSKGKTH